MKNIQEAINEHSRKCEVLASPIRNFIAVLAAAKGEITWSSLKSSLEKIHGSINPNTLSFHIGRLIEAGFLLKAGTEEQPRYCITDKGMQELENMYGKDFIKQVKKEA